ncbi:hypothetical protein HCG49_03930 [Arenibacter sp. 6A1]|uniref:hypothetical protein n=1 Tax=Arenibacter sp. 6A1 TaxID=2720391 RepID=UPI0014484044|nr:hypothetical protein [Arenibacter sp. 6A1]NKI25705.1 hypothetical protein [Arenibacter sp. 6A1]
MQALLFYKKYEALLQHFLKTTKHIAWQYRLCICKGGRSGKGAANPFIMILSKFPCNTGFVFAKGIAQGKAQPIPLHDFTKIALQCRLVFAKGAVQGKAEPIPAS